MTTLGCPVHFLIAQPSGSTPNSRMDTDPSAKSEDNPQPPSPEEVVTALFAESILTQAQTAMMLLGRATHPALKEPVLDTARAKKLIDQLELLEEKTTGLGAEETRLIRESLHTLRMAYVEVVGDNPPADSQSKPEKPKPSDLKPTVETSGDKGDDDPSPKRFVKKYD